MEPAGTGEAEGLSSSSTGLIGDALEPSSALLFFRASIVAGAATPLFLEAYLTLSS